MARYIFFIGLFLFSLLTLNSCDLVVTNQNKPEVPADHTVLIGVFLHKEGERSAAGCGECHGHDLKGGVQDYDGRKIYVQSCYQCHGQLWNLRESR